MYQVIFFGTSEFAVPILAKLINNPDFKILLVVTQPDAPQGRKKTLTPTPVKIFAERNGLAVFAPQKIKDREAIQKIKKIEPDFLILAAYGQILPRELLHVARYGAINVHPSLLPKYRGASPVQFALLHNEHETGITLIVMDEEIDHGPIVAQKKISINSDETTPDLKKRLAEISANLVVQTLSALARGEIMPQPQEHARATYTKVLKREDGHVDWQKSALAIYNMWRALQPWPGIWNLSRINGGTKLIKLNRIRVAQIPDERINKFTAGEVFVHDTKLYVRCKDGAVELERLQLEGKKEMSGDEFVHGYKSILGQILQ